MSSRGKRARKAAASRRTGDSGERGARRKGIAEPRRADREGRPGSWFRGKRPIMTFVVLFALLFGVFQGVMAIPWVKDTFFLGNLRLNARVSGAILGLFEESLAVSGTSIHSPRWSIQIARGCDAIDPVALFACALLAFPGAWSRKLPGLVVGTAALMALNQVRIITLFYVGIYFPRAFHIMHVDVWQAVFIFVALLFWVLWALWATPTRMPKTDVATATP